MEQRKPTALSDFARHGRPQLIEPQNCICGTFYWLIDEGACALARLLGGKRNNDRHCALHAFWTELRIDTWGLRLTRGWRVMPLLTFAPSTTLAEFIHAAALCMANFGGEDTAAAVVGRRAREWRAVRRASLAGVADATEIVAVLALLCALVAVYAAHCQTAISCLEPQLVQ
jgi:hypothetical protein